MDGTDFRPLPEAADRKVLCDLSNRLAVLMSKGQVPAADLPAVWGRLQRPIGRHDTLDALPDDESWRQLRRRCGKSTRELELDVVALLSPALLVDLPGSVLRQLGGGGAQLAEMDVSQRTETLMLGQLWDAKPAQAARGGATRSKVSKPTRWLPASSGRIMGTAAMPPGPSGTYLRSSTI